MSNPKMKPCPQCGSTDDLAVYGGVVCESTRHVECLKCNYLGPTEGSIRQAIKSHNDAALSAAGQPEGGGA